MATGTENAPFPDDAEAWLRRVADTPCVDCEHYPERLLKTAAQLSHHERLASLGSVIAGVAHELSSPAGYVLSNLGVLERYAGQLLAFLARLDADHSPKELEALKHEYGIARIAGDLDSLVEGTLEGAERIHGHVMNLSRYATPQRDVPREYDLCATIRTAVAWVSQASGDSVPVDYRMPPELTIVGHSNAVHQILINLVQNAVDAVAEVADACLEVVVDTDGDAVVVEVHDNGPGLGSEDPRRLFEPFVTSKPAGKGTGLGLSISHSLAEQEGGRLAAANGPGRGAVFTLHLPRSSCR